MPELNDEIFMRRCIEVAKLAAGNVAPNPMVGAVLVYEDKIIGEGYHQLFGKAHAEVNCIASVPAEKRHLIEKSTLYVSLEPCSHFGKTPPCTNLILDQKIKKVKIGCVDIFAAVHGRGIQHLKESGVNVEVGIIEKECIELNKRFFTFHKKQRPFIILKWAQTANGIIGKAGERISISNTYTSMLVHKWRSEEAGILIGYRTALNDDPGLTNRHWSGKSPVRIIFDKRNELPSTLSLFRQEGKAIVFNTIENKEVENVSFIKLDREKFLEEAMQQLYILQIQSIIVEGGSRTHQLFFDAGIWDECRIITNTVRTMNGTIAATTPEMKLVKQEMIMNDRISYYQNIQNVMTVD